MNTKKQYMAPALEVVELYEDLMLIGASGENLSIKAEESEKYYNTDEYGDIN